MKYYLLPLVSLWMWVKPVLAVEKQPTDSSVLFLEKSIVSGVIDSTSFANGLACLEKATYYPGLAAEVDHIAKRLDKKNQFVHYAV